MRLVSLRTLIAVLLALSGITIIVTVNVNVDVTPPEHRHGWAGLDVLEQEPMHVVGEFRIDGPPQDNSRKNVRLWDYTKALNGGEHLPNYAQQVGDCVSFGVKNAVDYLQAVQIVEANMPAEFKATYPPFYYGTSRVQVGGARLGGDGSLGVWGAKAAQEYGALPSDKAPPYSGSIARQWGRRPGPPQQYLDIARDFRIKTIAKVSSAEQVRDAICNGYTVTIASNWGGIMRPPTVDGRLVSRRSGSWAHQMAVVAYDGETGAEPYWYILNSWGERAHGMPPDGSPPGGFWVRKADMDWITRSGDCWAFSNFEGFPPRDLDFTIIGDDGGTAMLERLVWTATDPIGAWVVGLVLIAMAIVLVICKCHRIRKVVLVGTAGVLAFGAATAFAEDFTILDVPPRSTASVDFSLLDAVPYASLRPDTDPERRPVVYLYSTASCFVCAELETELRRREGRLPFRVIVKHHHHPDWLRTTPTFHWSAGDGRGRRYEGAEIAELLRRWNDSRWIKPVKTSLTSPLAYGAGLVGYPTYTMPRQYAMPSRRVGVYAAGGFGVAC